jgi:hypothetical protein
MRKNYMSKHYLRMVLLLSLGSCSAPEKPPLLEVGGNQLPQESISSQLKNEQPSISEKEADAKPDEAQMYAPSTYNIQAPTGPGLDALPTLLIPSPSGHKVVILPPPSR